MLWLQLAWFFICPMMLKVRSRALAAAIRSHRRLAGPRSGCWVESVSARVILRISTDLPLSAASRSIRKRRFLVRVGWLRIQRR
ncbi:hypothetical protein AMK23_35445 [Streptomyces sp. CB02130]|nr:hypothetical protein AMK23_35445 [Streptomyces sp. CB02130]